MQAIEAQNVGYEYPEDAQSALSDVSLSVAPGEFVAVLGHNGSGKSTLAKLVNGLYLPSQGTMRVCGMDTSVSAHIWDVRQSAGMVFQNPDNQLVATIVEEDVAFGLENMGVPSQEIQKRVHEALCTVGMEDFAKAAPHMLSGGQKQRVAIAGILAMKPKAIVFDESTAMLDPSGRREVLDTVMRLNREEGITILWITHFMEEAAKADRVVVMDGGRIALSGTPREVFTQVELVKGYGLDVPMMAELAQWLSERGMDIPRDILTVEEMVQALCQLR